MKKKTFEISLYVIILKSAINIRVIYVTIGYEIFLGTKYAIGRIEKLMKLCYCLVVFVVNWLLFINLMYRNSELIMCVCEIDERKDANEPGRTTKAIHYLKNWKIPNIERKCENRTFIREININIFGL